MEAKTAPLLDASSPSTPAASKASASSSHTTVQFELPLYQHVRRAIAANGWQCTSEHTFQSRKLEYNAAFGEMLLGKLGEGFIKHFGVASIFSDEHTDKANGILNGPIEIDFNAPIVPLSTEPLVPGGRVLGTKQESPDRDCKNVALFELTRTNDFDYKMFQLERNITAYKLHREQQREPIDIPIAGIIARTLPVDAEKLLDTEANVKMLPQLAALHRKGMLIFVELGDGNQPLSRTLAACWVVYRLSPPGEVPQRYTVPFEVAPAKNTVDSLKKAVRPTWDPVEQAMLTVKDYKGNVLRPSAPLKTNTEETAYMVE